MKYLAIDWGLKRVGLATSDGQLATPLKTLVIDGLADGVNKVISIAKQESVEHLVIGLPEGEMARNVQKAAQVFRQKDWPVELTDETLSSKRALTEMINQGLSQKARKDDNAVAAAIILQEYLDNLKG